MDSPVLTYLPLVSPIATLIVVIVGVLFSNRHVDIRIADLRAYTDARFDGIQARFDALQARIDSLDHLFQERLQRVEEILDARLSRIEQELRLK